MESAGILEYASVTRVGLVKIAQQVGIFQISMMYNFGSHELQCVSVYMYYVPLYHSVLYMSRQRYIQRRNKVFIYSGLKQRSLEGYRVKGQFQMCICLHVATSGVIAVVPEHMFLMTELYAHAHTGKIRLAIAIDDYFQ